MTLGPLIGWFFSCYPDCVKPSRAYHDYTSYHREPGGLRRLDFFVEQLQKCRGEKQDFSVLDVGCGLGNISLPLAALGFKVTGVDVDGPSVEKARDRARELGLKIEFIQGSLDAVRGKTFDAVVVSEVLEHLKHPILFLQELRAAIRPDGCLLFSVPNGGSLEERVRRFTTHTRVGRGLKTWLKKRIRRMDVQSLTDSPHEQFYSWRRLENELQSQGFNLETVRPAAAWFKEFFALLGRLWMKRGSSAFHRLDAWDARLAGFLPLGLADGWLGVARLADRSRPLVLQVVTTLDGGGAEKLAYQLTRDLPAHGFNAKTIAILHGGPTEALFKRSATPYVVLGQRGWLGWRATRELYRIFKRERPSVVNTHLFGADAWGRLAAWLARVPCIVSTEHNVNFEHGLIKTAVKSALAHITDGFIAVSGVVKERMVKHDRIAAQKIKVILNGIELDDIEPHSSGSFHDVPRLLAVGRLEAQKNHATLLKALAQVHEPWTLEIAGVGSLEAELKQLAARLGLEARVRFLGYRDDIPELLAQADLFCFPSRWEGLGLALLEAAAAGVPIVASDLPVFKEILQADQARFVAAWDVPAWARTIGEILRDPQAAGVRAQSARHQVQREFSIEGMVGKYAEVYRKCQITNAK